MQIKNFALRLDNSICDYVTIRTPNNIFKVDQTTPVSEEELKMIFPHRIGVLLGHINPNDTTDRKCFVYIDRFKESDSPSDIDITFNNFEMTPKMFHEHLTTNNIRDRIYTIRLDNLIYILPYKFKKDKLLTDGKSYAMIKDLNNSCFPRSIKEKLANFDWATKDQSIMPDLKTECGLVYSDTQIKDLFPIRVDFPNGVSIKCRAEDMMFFHELEE